MDRWRDPHRALAEPAREIPPTGKEIALSGMRVLRLAGGGIAATRVVRPIRRGPGR